MRIISAITFLLLLIAMPIKGNVGEVTSERRVSEATMTVSSKEDKIRNNKDKDKKKEDNPPKSSEKKSKYTGISADSLAKIVKKVVDVEMNRRGYKKVSNSSIKNAISADSLAKIVNAEMDRQIDKPSTSIGLYLFSILNFVLIAFLGVLTLKRQRRANPTPFKPAGNEQLPTINTIEQRLQKVEKKQEEINQMIKKDDKQREDQPKLPVTPQPIINPFFPDLPGNGENMPSPTLYFSGIRTLPNGKMMFLQEMQDASGAQWQLMPSNKEYRLNEAALSFLLSRIDEFVVPFVTILNPGEVPHPKSVEYLKAGKVEQAGDGSWYIHTKVEIRIV